MQETFRQLAGVLGALYHHETDSRRSPAGWPDVALTVPGSGVLWLLELKTETGRLRPEQIGWGLALMGCDEVRYRLVRPSDLEATVREIAEQRKGARR